MSIFFMKNIVSILLVITFRIYYAEAQQALINKVENPVDWANPLVGTDSSPSLSNGNTYPAIAMPWGMNFWTPQTGKMVDGGAYTYDGTKIKGFK